MKERTKIKDRQVGRNAELFAHSIAELGTPEERYPFIRILISIVEQAHPEWNQAPNKDAQIGHIVSMMSEAKLDNGEVAHVVRVRDEERGYGPPPKTTRESTRQDDEKKETEDSGKDASEDSDDRTPDDEKPENSSEEGAPEEEANDEGDGDSGDSEE